MNQALYAHMNNKRKMKKKKKVAGHTQEFLMQLVRKGALKFPSTC
jgi:hypothetical protein